MHQEELLHGARDIEFLEASEAGLSGETALTGFADDRAQARSAFSERDCQAVIRAQRGPHSAGRVPVLHRIVGSRRFRPEVDTDGTPSLRHPSKAGFGLHENPNTVSLFRTRRGSQRHGGSQSGACLLSV